VIRLLIAAYSHLGQFKVSDLIPGDHRVGNHVLTGYAATPQVYKSSAPPAVQDQPLTERSLSRQPLDDDRWVTPRLSVYDRELELEAWAYGLTVSVPYKAACYLAAAEYFPHAVYDSREGMEVANKPSERRSGRSRVLQARFEKFWST